jgi:hypothetical protein
LATTWTTSKPQIVCRISFREGVTTRIGGCRRTRVVQVIHAVDPNSRLLQEKKVLVGQLVDVFIDTRPSDQSGGSASAASEPKPENWSTAP